VNEPDTCPVCHHETLAHPNWIEGGRLHFVCSRSIEDLPSCRECRAQFEALLSRSLDMTIAGRTGPGKTLMGVEELAKLARRGDLVFYNWDIPTTPDLSDLPVRTWMTEDELAALHDDSGDERFRREYQGDWPSCKPLPPSEPPPPPRRDQEIVSRRRWRPRNW
jgi:hypothetical protein